jgi:hypothetical protein
MKIASTLALALAFLGAPHTSFAEEAPGYGRRVERAKQALETPDCAAVLAEGAMIAADPRFSTLDRARRRDFLGVLGTCALKNDDAERAFQTAEQAARLEPTELWAQLTRMSYGHRLGSPAVTVAAFRAIAASNPGQVRALEAREIQAVVDAARRSDPSGAASREVETLLDAIRSASPPP